MQLTDNSTHLFSRGYTGHEHLDKFGLINMNGRLYDSKLARFLSPDPFLQDPSNTQNFNRYSYCLNNPFAYTDPSGYTVKPNTGIGSGQPSVVSPVNNQYGWESIYDQSFKYFYNWQRNNTYAALGGIFGIDPKKTNVSKLVNNAILCVKLIMQGNSVFLQKEKEGYFLRYFSNSSTIAEAGASKFIFGYLSDKEASYISALTSILGADLVDDYDRSNNLQDIRSLNKKVNNSSGAIENGVQGTVTGFEFNLLFYSINLGVVRFDHDNESRGLSFSFQSGPGFNISANFYAGVIRSKKELNYSDLEGAGVSLEGGSILGGAYTANRLNDPLYEIYTASYGIGYTKLSGNAMQTKTAIIRMKAFNCENCY